MRELMTEAGLTPPTFISDRTRNQFIVTCLFHHFLSPEDWIWLRSFRDAELSDEEARALVYAREMEAVDNATYRHLNHVDVLTASQHLRRLRDRGLLAQKGKGSETYYVPTEQLLAPWNARAAVSPSPGEPPQPGNPVPPIAQPVALSSNLPGQSSNSLAQSRNPASLIAKHSGLPLDLAETLAGLKGRVTSPEMQALAYRLCLWQPLAKDTMARLLGRNADYVHTRIIRPMLRDGRLAMTIPDQPNHPEQRYRAIVAPKTD
jgi:ATP-dependent DNA helicase RecG